MNQFNLSRLTDTMFRRVDGVVWDVMSGKIGIVTDEGIATLEGIGDDATVNINMMDEFGVAIPAYAQSTQQADVKEGDIIVTGNKISWVIERNVTDSGVRYKTMKPSGDTGSWVPPKKSIMGMDTGVMVLHPLMNFVGSTNSGGLQGMQQMLMTMAMMGGDNASAASFDRIMPMMLMSGMTQGGTQNSMQMMLMMQMLQQGGMNVFGTATNATKNSNSRFN